MGVPPGLGWPEGPASITPRAWLGTARATLRASRGHTVLPLRQKAGGPLAHAQERFAEASGVREKREQEP